MDDVVPNTLQRLRAAEIIRVAGLAVASLGQEYSRIGAVQGTMRQGTQLLGVVDTTALGHGEAATATNTVADVEHGTVAAHITAPSEQHRHIVDVELQTPNLWIAHCSCSPLSSVLCAHAAGLLYHWLAHPQSFPSASTVSTSNQLPPPTPLAKRNSHAPTMAPAKATRRAGPVGHVVAMRGPTPAASFAEILAQIGLSELRGIAREYDIVISGLSKQQLIETIIGILKRSEAVRKVAAALEKPQRQLLATLALAGGSMTDEDLRGLHERFAFGQPDKLQAILLSLQAKGLLFHISLNSAPQQRIGLSGSVYDVGWYIPAEVQAALRVPVPVTPFNFQNAEHIGAPGVEPSRVTELTTAADRESDVAAQSFQIQQVQPYSLLTDLLLVGRVLNGYRLEHDDEKEERAGTQRPAAPFAAARPANAFINDGTVGILPPTTLPSTTLLKTLQKVLSHPPLFLRYAVRLLRLADILHKDDTGTPYLRLLSNAARLLVGSTYTEVARDLFELWLTQPSYEELYELQEEGLRLRCRTTPLNHSILRPGELEAENCEARQWLVALIAQAPQHQWISFSAFARFIYRLNPTFLQKRQRLFPSPHWWLEQEEGRPLQPKQMADWMRVEGHYLARLLRGPLHWWGIADLALSADGRLLAFRLTPMAGLLLNGLAFEDSQDSEQEREAQSNAAPTLVVRETGEVLVSCSFAAWPLIELIEDFTEAAGVRDDRLCYQLSPKFLAEALSHGRQPTALLNVLRTIVVAEDLPDSPLQKLITQLANWTASYGRVRLYTDVSLLEIADTLVMRELTATTSIEEQIVQAIKPTLLILKKQGMERMIEDLKRRGSAPLLHEGVQHGTE